MDRKRGIDRMKANERGAGMVGKDRFAAVSAFMSGRPPIGSQLALLRSYLYRVPDVKSRGARAKPYNGAKN